MLRVNYEYRKGVLFVRVEGCLDSRNIYLLDNSIKQIIKIGGIKYVVLNVEKVCALNDSYIRFLIEDIKSTNIYLCGYNSEHYNNVLLNRESNIFNYINL
jgi:hypothetical protein